MVNQELNEKLKKVILGNMNLAQSSSPVIQGQKGIIEEKYLLTFTRYPNGVVYPRIFKIGETLNKMTAKKKQKRKVEQIRLQDEEVY